MRRSRRVRARYVAVVSRRVGSSRLDRIETKYSVTRSQLLYAGCYGELGNEIYLSRRTGRPYTWVDVARAWDTGYFPICTTARDRGRPLSIFVAPGTKLPRDPDAGNERTRARLPLFFSPPFSFLLFSINDESVTSFGKFFVVRRTRETTADGARDAKEPDASGCRARTAR